MATTECLLQDPSTLHTKLWTAEQELRVMEHSAALLQEICESLTHVIEEHSEQDARLLEPLVKRLAPVRAVTRQLADLISELQAEHDREEPLLSTAEALAAPYATLPPIQTLPASVAPFTRRMTSPPAAIGTPTGPFRRTALLAVGFGLAVMAGWGVMRIPPEGFWLEQIRAATPAIAAVAGPAWPKESLRVLHRMRIQYEGRVEPFDRFASRMLASITGKGWAGREDPVQTLLSLVAKPDLGYDRPLVLVPSSELREALQLPPSVAHASLRQLAARRHLMWQLPLILEQERWGGIVRPYEREAVRVYERATTLARVLAQEFYLVPPAPGTEGAWRPILLPEGYLVEQQVGVKRSWASLLEAIRQSDPEQIQAASQRLTLVLRNLSRQQKSEAFAFGLKRVSTVLY